MTKLEEFRNMVLRHDLTYDYSDDSTKYRRGYESFLGIKEAAKELPLDVVRKVWNAKVDREISAKYAADWYWKDPRDTEA